MFCAVVPLTVVEVGEIVGGILEEVLDVKEVIGEVMLE